METPPFMNSWVDLSQQASPPPSELDMEEENEAPDRVTSLPFGNGEEYLRLLREAQNESNPSSPKASLTSSRKSSAKGSPKSPPNSPNTELIVGPEVAPLKGVYINYYNKEGDFVNVVQPKGEETDWIWDWSSRPDQTPPKNFRFVHPGKGGSHGASIRKFMVGRSSLFSRDVLYTLLITNVLSLIIGTGIGIWWLKRSNGTVVMGSVPMN